MHDAPAGVRDAHVGVVFAAGADAVRSTMRRSQVRSPGFFVHRLSVHLFHRSISIAAFHRNRAFTTVEKRIVRVVDARGGATYSVPRMRWVGSHQGLSCRVVVPPPLHSTARAEEPERLSVGTATPLADAANLAMTKPTISKLVAKLAAAS